MKKREWMLFVALLSCGPLAAAATEVRAVKDLTRLADFVFRGTVEEAGAANLSLVEPNAKTAIVRVDEVWKAGGTLDDFTGRKVTVFLKESLRAGDRRVFFTSVRLLGESLGVQEVGRATGSAAVLRRKVQKAESDLFQEGVAARVAAADLVVTGRIRETREASSAGRQSEHDPMWREAVLEVSSVLKGKVLEKTVAFWYPGSFDVMWARVPKPSAGQEGTWLLHRSQPEEGAAIYAAADPGDRLTDAEVKAAKATVKP